MDQHSPAGFSVSGLAIRQHIGTLMLTLAVIVVGLFFGSTLQVDLLPAITYPRIGVRLDAPGVSPDVAIDEITRPLESALSATEGVVQIYSQTREGQISVDLYFQPGGNIDQALNEATATFNRARSTLPDNLSEPRLFKLDPSQLPVYELALSSSNLSLKDLQILADEELGRELSVLPGVASVNVSGGLAEEVRVLLDLPRMQALGLGINEVVNRLRNSNQDISGGRLLGIRQEPLTRAVGRFRGAEDVRNLPFTVGVARGETGNPSTASPALVQRMKLTDFAQVVDGTEEQRVFVTLNGQPAVKVSLQKQPDANTIEVVQAVKRRLDELRQSNVISADVDLIPTFDESIFIQNAIANVMSAGLMGTGLAAIAVLLFLGSLRQTFIIVLAIPLATLTALILMRLFGLSLNVFSLGGLALGVGIVVDNSIVMLETIADGLGMTPGQDARTRLRPQQLLAAAMTSGQSVESALVASTTTNLVAVLPFLMIGGFIALLFNELILTVSFAIAASILVAVTVVPMLATQLLGIPISSHLGRFVLLRGFQRSFDASVWGYRGMLRWVLQWRWIILLITVLVFGGSSLWLAPTLQQEILPQIQTGQVQLTAQFPPGTTLATNRQVMTALDNALLAQPETADVFTTSGGALFGSSTISNPLRGSSTITLQPNTDVNAYIKRVNAQIQTLNLVDIRVRLSPGLLRGLILSNSPVRADLDVILQGEDSTVLEAAGRDVLKALDAATLSSYRPDSDRRQPELQVRLDPERAADQGLTVQDVGTVLETAIAGVVPTQLQRGNRLVDIRVQIDQNTIRTPSQLEQLPVFTPQNQLVQLQDVARLEPGQAPGEIQRINQRQVFLIAGTLNEGVSFGAAFAEVNAILAKLPLPDGVSRLPSSSAQSNESIQGALPLLASLAAFLVFVVMAVQYNSLVDPFVIMFTLPLALAGAIAGLSVTQTPVGATVIVGAVLLVGIVVNNAIVMVELANQIRETEGCDRRTAILDAAPRRLRPILMTTITTVLGMFPLALGVGDGGEFLQPLGIVVFSGLAVATVLTLFVIPCLYVILHDVFGLGEYLRKWR